MRVRDVKKVVLAYSGGLDTSVILRWLQVTYRCEVVTFTADLGQGEELGPARQKAELLGVKEIFMDDLRETFVHDFVFPMFRATALYEGQYLLGTSIARPLIAQRQIEIAELIAACRRYPGASNARRITFEYVMLKGVNDSQTDARELVRLIAGIPAKVNLIPFNPWPGSPFETSSNSAIDRFARIVMDAGFASPVRSPRGRDILAACGQLRTESRRTRPAA